MDGEKLYRVIGHRFACGVSIVNGRVDAKYTAPILRRLTGLAEPAFHEYARRRGWHLEMIVRQ